MYLRFGQQKANYVILGGSISHFPFFNVPMVTESVENESNCYPNMINTL